MGEKKSENFLEEEENEILFDGLFSKEFDSLKKIVEYFRD